MAAHGLAEHGPEREGRLALSVAKSVGFDNIEAVVRIPAIALLVNTVHLSAMVAAALTLVIAFVARFMFHSLVVYAPRRVTAEKNAAAESGAGTARSTN